MLFKIWLSEEFWVQRWLTLLFHWMERFIWTERGLGACERWQQLGPVSRSVTMLGEVCSVAYTHMNGNSSNQWTSRIFQAWSCNPGITLYERNCIYYQPEWEIKFNLIDHEKNKYFPTGDFKVCFISTSCVHTQILISALFIVVEN